MVWPSFPSLFLFFFFLYLAFLFVHLLLPHFTLPPSCLLWTHAASGRERDREREREGGRWHILFACVCGCSPSLAFVYVDLCRAPKVARTHGFFSIIINYTPARPTVILLSLLPPCLYKPVSPPSDIYFSAMLTTATLIFYMRTCSVIIIIIVIITVMIWIWFKPLIPVDLIGRKEENKMNIIYLAVTALIKCT